MSVLYYFLSLCWDDPRGPFLLYSEHLFSSDLYSFRDLFICDDDLALALYLSHCDHVFITYSYILPLVYILMSDFSHPFDLSPLRQLNKPMANGWYMASLTL